MGEIDNNKSSDKYDQDNLLGSISDTLVDKGFAVTNVNPICKCFKIKSDSKKSPKKPTNTVTIILNNLLSINSFVTRNFII